MSIKEQSEVFRRGLLLGLFRVLPVIAWCDSVIMAEPSPDVAIIEASLAGSRGADAVARALSEADGDFEESKVISALFRPMLDILNANAKQASTIGEWLYRMVQNGWAPNEEVEADMINLPEDMDMAQEGICGNLEAVTNEMRRFLEKYSAPNFTP